MNRREEETVRLDKLCIGYRSKRTERVVAGPMDAAIYGGELTCLLGTNGVGKSTLLRTLSAFQPRLGGSVRLLGKELDSYSDRALSTAIGVVLTDRCDVRNMRVRELIGMGRSPYTGFWGKLGADDLRIVNESIALVHIEALAGRMVHTLSDGERQKVMIAKALAQETPVIYLDEPTAFLDFPSKVEIMRLLHRLTRKMGKTIFLSTHDLELALQIADKIWLMGHEGMLSVGTPEDLALEGRLDRFFSREGIVFDKETGLFRVDNRYGGALRLVGEGQRYAMVRKALGRNGIRADREVLSSLWIDAGSSLPDRFVVHEPDGTRSEAHTIAELLRVLPEPGNIK